MKKLFLALLIMLLVIVSSIGCDNMNHTPGWRQINDTFRISRLYDEETKTKNPTLVKKGKIEEGESDEFIIAKNFVAYAIEGDMLVLCEETSEKKNRFWTFDLKTEALSEYKTLKELLEILSVEHIEWSPLWVKDFTLAGE